MQTNGKRRNVARKMATDKKSRGIGKGTPGPGRPKGAPNKTTVAMREAFIAAFNELGGVNGLVAWGKRNPGKFYELSARLLPKEIAVSGDLSMRHVLNIHDEPRAAG